MDGQDSPSGVELRVGTSGFSYKEWRGAFYPDDLPADRMLRYYADRLGAVEINNTFYRMPTRSLLEGWAESVPPDFRFALKASRRITHQKKLRDAGDDVRYLADTASVMGSRLGPLLIQLPPYLKRDVDLLSTFVDEIPEGVRAAFEFRSTSWFDDAVYEVLAGRSLALVVSDTDEDTRPPVVVRTAPYGYARLRRVAYDDDALTSWWHRLRATEVDELYVFFKHEDEGTGPRLAARFRSLAEEG